MIVTCKLDCAVVYMYICGHLHINQIGLVVHQYPPDKSPIGIKTMDSNVQNVTDVLYPFVRIS